MHSLTADELSAYLSGRLSPGEVIVDDVVEHVEGWSRYTVSFTATWDDGAESHVQRLVLRAESEEQVGADVQFYGDIEREYEAMAAVQETEVPIPETYWFDADASLLPGRFFLVEHRDGEAPVTWNENWRERLYEEWDAAEKHLPHAFVDAITSIHTVDPADVSAVEDRPPGRVVEYEIERKIDQYRETPLVDEPIMEETIRWLRSNRPSVPETTLVHGDYRIGNVLVEDDDITAVLDWEFARAGDPLYDLAYASTNYYAGKLVDHIERPDLACALLDREWFYDQYEARTGRRVDHDRLRYWRVFTLFLIVSNSMRGMYRFREGNTDDVRNAWFQFTIPGLLEDLQALIRDDRAASA